jgi:tetratricopeptide (TPR) repeat protein
LFNLQICSAAIFRAPGGTSIAADIAASASYEEGWKLPAPQEFALLLQWLTGELRFKGNLREVLMASAPSEGPRPSLTPCLRRLHELWEKVPGTLPFILLGMLVLLAFWDSRKHVTTIAPFQVPKADLPFTGEMVSDALQDGLESMHNEIEVAKVGSSLQSYETGVPDLRNMHIPSFQHIQEPPRFAVEVKGVSYEQLLAIARGLLRTETKISGDLIVQADSQDPNKKMFVLVARATNAGPWESAPSPISPEGLKQASRDLATKILSTLDPTFAGAALIRDGKFDEGTALLYEEHDRNPSNSKLTLNLCVGYGATRRYKEAIDCYEKVLPSTDGAAQRELLRQEAQAYYLQGEDRNKAIQIYRGLVAHGDSAARLGLGEALDADGKFDDAINEYDIFLAGNHSPRELAIAHLGKSIALADKNRHEDALLEADNALHDAPRDVLVLVHKGTELADAGYLDAGIALLKSVEHESHGTDTSPFVLLQLGKLLKTKGDLHKAADYFRQATKLQPNYVEAHQALADTAARLGRKGEALAEYGMIAKMSDSYLDRGDSDFLAREWLGNALRDDRKYADAAAMYREALRLKPKDGVLLCELAFMKENMGDVLQATRDYREIVRKPDQLDVSGLAHKEVEANRRTLLALAHRRLGDALIRLGETHWPSGIDELRSAVDLKPRDPDYLMALADGYYNTHRFAEAAAEYREVISVASDSKMMQAAAQAKLHQAEQRAKLQPSSPAVQAIV